MVQTNMAKVVVGGGYAFERLSELFRVAAISNALKQEAAHKVVSFFC